MDHWLDDLGAKRIMKVGILDDCSSTSTSGGGCQSQIHQCHVQSHCLQGLLGIVGRSFMYIRFHYPYTESLEHDIVQLDKSFCFIWVTLLVDIVFGGSCIIIIDINHASHIQCKGTNK